MHIKTQPTLAMALAAASMLALAGCSSPAPTPSESTSAPTPGDEFADVRALVPADLAEAGVIRNASSFTAPPVYFYEEGTTTPSGVYIDLTTAIADAMGLDVEWQQIPYAGLVPALDSEQIEVGVGLFSANPANVESANIVSLTIGTSAITTLDDNPFEELTDACGTTLGVTRGATTELLSVDVLNAACDDAGESQATVQEYASSSDMIVAVKSGNIDGFLGSAIYAAAYDANEEDGLRSNLIGEFPRRGAGVVVQKDATELADAMIAATNAIIENGTYEEILTEWDVPESLWVTESQLNNTDEL